jgi:mono/diheme cytochrome c family protein
LALEVEQASRGATDPALRREAADDAAARAQQGALARFAALLRGGDAERGRRVFEEHAGAACLRCHTLDGRGGKSGPDLSVIGTHSRSELLGSLVDPGAQIAPGYETTSMPPMGELLTPRELRDLVEYLATRRDVAPDAYLGGLAAEQVVSRRDCLAVDRTCRGGRLRVAGHEFAHGVGAIAPSRLVYAVPPGSRAFVGLAALDDVSHSGQVEFSVLVDGREVWRSGAVRPGRSMRIYLELPPDAARLELRARDTGYGAIHSDVSWLEAGFLRR